jgi:signal transduction histidine kinase
MVTNLAVYRQRLRDVAAGALRAGENERKRMALELHDDTAPTLVALLARLGAARATRDSAARDTSLEEVCDDLARAIEGVRRIARALRPPALEEMGVVAAVREQARSVAEASGLRIDVDSDPIDGLLAPEAELALYRVVQEALSNVTRHAAARTARVHIECVADTIVTTVSDDGKGFAVTDERQRTERGLGLFGMQERAEYLGGSVDVFSRPGRGTSIRVKIPATPNDDGD